MKITILTADNHYQTFWRVAYLRKLFKKHFTTEIINIKFSETDDHLFRYEFPEYKCIDFLPGKVFNDLMNNVNGELIYALKTSPLSFGMALSIKNHKKKPVFLDIDCIEKLNRYPYSNKLLKKVAGGTIQFNNPNSLIYTTLLEKRTEHANHIFTTNKNLQSIYGGNLLPEQCDLDLFNSDLYDRSKIRKSINCSNKKVILLHEHCQSSLSDLDKLVEIVYGNLNNVMIIYIGPKQKKFKSSKYENILQMYNWQPKTDTAKLYAAADLIFISNERKRADRKKTPETIYMALASKLSIITTIEDVKLEKEILDFIFTTNEEKLKDKITELLCQPELANNKKLNGREWVEKSSKSNKEVTLIDICKMYEKD